MKLIVLIALVGCALAIPNPYPEEEYGPANGLRIPGTIKINKMIKVLIFPNNFFIATNFS